MHQSIEIERGEPSETGYKNQKHNHNNMVVMRQSLEPLQSTSQLQVQSIQIALQ